MGRAYKVGDNVFGSWELVKLIGEGSYGRVYEAHREINGQIYKSAVKVMEIPHSQSEVASVQSEGLDERSVTAYFSGIKDEVVREFELMSKLKGKTNIVSCEDFDVIPFEEGIGWTIIIRMELLKPMLEHISSTEITRKDVIKVGIDLCRALEICQRYSIIHRDIKPENIFVSDLGDYKLGDFGIARTMEASVGGMSSKVGSPPYMAPEIYNNRPYDQTVDTYSLGIVLYRLLNNNRTPFLPQPPALITYSDKESAQEKRMAGASIPKPANADEDLSRIVLKACAYNPKDRYESPQQMRENLEALIDKTIGPRPSKPVQDDVLKPSPAVKPSVDPDPTLGPRSPKPAPGDEQIPQRYNYLEYLIAVAVAVIIIIIAVRLIVKPNNPDTESVSREVTQAPSQEISGESEDAGGKCGENVKWTLSEGVLTISGTGLMYDYGYDNNIAPWIDLENIIVSTIIEDGVTSIGNGAFNECTNMISITIPSSVTFIGDGAFSGCSKLRRITIPSEVMSIGSEAFCGCNSLTNIAIPSGVTAIGAYAFAFCSSLRNIEIPPSVTTIGYAAFEGCSSLTDITLPSSVTFIGDSAFYDCSSLRDVYYSGTETQRSLIEIDESNDDLKNATWHYTGDSGDITQEYRPSEYDLDSINAHVVYPKQGEYLYNYEYKTVYAELGSCYALYGFLKSDNAAVPQIEVYNGTPVKIIAKHTITGTTDVYCCCIFDYNGSTIARWINEGFLV